MAHPRQTESFLGLAGRDVFALWLLCSFVFALSSFRSAASEPGFVVQHFLINGGAALSSNTLYSVLVKYTGTNVSLAELANAASELQSAYSEAGYN